MKNCLIAGLLFFNCLAATAQKLTTAQQVDAYIERQMHQKKITGLTLAVVKDGKVVKATGYGMANIENKVPATAQTVYKIASVSKQFLAAGILLLQQDGKLNITDKLSRYIPEVPASWSAITLQRLLNHSAGLPLDIPAFDPYKMQTDSALISSLFPLALQYASGDKLSYSNAGYFVVAEVIRQVSGMPWDEFIEKRIFKPLQMQSTRATTTSEILNNRARGYKVINGRTSNAEDWVALRPSGAFVSTVGDMAKWDAALYGNAILSAESKQQLWSPVRFNNGGALSYALGWNLLPFQGHNRVFHDGGLPGFSADFERFIDDRLTVIVLCNTEDVDAGKLAVTVAGFYNRALQVKTK